MAELVAAVDVNQEALKVRSYLTGLPAEKCLYGFERSYSRNADFINIVVPPQFHEEVIDIALEAGLDIICEKPLGDTMEASARIYKRGKSSRGESWLLR